MFKICYKPKLNLKIIFKIKILLIFNLPINFCLNHYYNNFIYLYKYIKYFLNY